MLNTPEPPRTRLLIGNAGIGLTNGVSPARKMPPVLTWRSRPQRPPATRSVCIFIRVGWPGVNSPNSCPITAKNITESGGCTKAVSRRTEGLQETGRFSEGRNPSSLVLGIRPPTGTPGIAPGQTGTARILSPSQITRVLAFPKERTSGN